MNHLEPAGDEGTWSLPRHAHVIVYEGAEGELLTIYDCAAAQKPPSAQFRGHLVRVDAAHEHSRTPVGYTVKLREEAALIEQGEDHYVIRA